MRIIGKDGYYEEWDEKDKKRFKWWAIIKDVVEMMEKEKALRKDYVRLKTIMLKLKKLKMEKDEIQAAHASLEQRNNDIQSEADFLIERFVD